MDDQHIYHHNADAEPPRINVKVERNTKGYNWEASVTGALSVEQAMELLKEVEASLHRTYGSVPG